MYEDILPGGPSINSPFHLFHQSGLVGSKSGSESFVQSPVFRSPSSHLLTDIPKSKNKRITKHRSNPCEVKLNETTIKNSLGSDSSEAVSL